MVVVLYSDTLGTDRITCIIQIKQINKSWKSEHNRSIGKLIPGTVTWEKEALKKEIEKDCTDEEVDEKSDAYTDR